MSHRPISDKGDKLVLLFAPDNMPPFQENSDKFPFEDSLLDSSSPCQSPKIIPTTSAAEGSVSDPRKEHQQLERLRGSDPKIAHRLFPHDHNTDVKNSKLYYFPKYEFEYYARETPFFSFPDKGYSTTRKLFDPRLSRRSDCLGATICPLLQLADRNHEIYSSDNIKFGVNCEVFSLGLRPADLSDLQVQHIQEETVPENFDSTIELEKLRDDLLERTLANKMPQHSTRTAEQSEGLEHSRVAENCSKKASSPSTASALSDGEVGESEETSTATELPTILLTPPPRINPPITMSETSVNEPIIQASVGVKRSSSTNLKDKMSSPRNELATLEEDKLLLARITKQSASPKQGEISPSLGANSPQVTKRVVSDTNGSSAGKRKLLSDSSDSESDIYQAVPPKTVQKEHLILRRSICKNMTRPHTLYTRSVSKSSDLVFWDFIRSLDAQEAQKTEIPNFKRKNGKCKMAMAPTIQLSARFDLLNKSSLKSYDLYVAKCTKAKQDQDRKMQVELIQNIHRSSSSLINASLDSIKEFQNKTHKRKRTKSPQSLPRSKRQSSEGKVDQPDSTEQPDSTDQPDSTGQKNQSQSEKYKNVPLKDLELAKHLIYFCPCWVETNQHNDIHIQSYIEFLFLVHNRYSTVKIEVDIVKRALTVLARNFDSVPRERFLLRMALFTTELVKLLSGQ